MKQTDKFLQSVNLINEITAQYDSMRAFAKTIQEHCSDVSRWCAGKSTIKLRAVIEICRLFPTIMPHQLNSEIFPEDLTFTFKRKK
jgi:hypothetical protein